MKKIQLGSFLFSEVEGEPDKVFIQIVEDGEGGNFDLNTLPHEILTFLASVMKGATITAKGHSSCDLLMWKFWEENF